MKDKNILTYRNNWENDEYYVDGGQISSLKEVKIGRNKYKVRTRSEGADVSDMGQQYRTFSDHYFITVKTELGITIDIDLNTIAPGYGSRRQTTQIIATKFKWSGE
jgi:hypothetical protein